MPSRFSDIPLCAERLRSLLSTAWMGSRLTVYDELDSTNTTAMAQARQGAPHGTVILSETQHAGRGRLGRSWHSPPHVNLYCSIVLRKLPPPTGLPWISLAAGLALCDALRTHVSGRLALKWPNDVLFGSRKVGGILCEVACQGKQDWVAVIGWGLNVNLEQHQLPPDLLDIATSLLIATGQRFDRHVLFAHILLHLETFYDRLLTGDLSAIRKAYVRHCRTIGQEVRVHYADGTTLQGMAVDVGQDGALHIQLSPSHALGLATPKSSSFVKIQAGEILHLREQPDSSLWKNCALNN